MIVANINNKLRGHPGLGLSPGGFKNDCDIKWEVMGILGWKWSRF